MTKSIDLVVSLGMVSVLSACQPEVDESPRGMAAESPPAELVESLPDGAFEPVPKSAFVQDEPRAHADTEPIGSVRALKLSRPVRTGAEVIARARALAVVITGADELLTGEGRWPESASGWEDAVWTNPDSPSTVNMSLDGHNLSVTYLPATDTLSMLSKDVVDRAPPDLVPGEKHVGVGEDQARVIARACADALASEGAIPALTYSREPIQGGERVTAIADKAYVSQYDFVFVPKPDGIPLRSMDLRIGVAAQSGRCRIITVSLVEFEDADVVKLVASAQAAREFVRAEVERDPRVGSATVGGYIGYLLEPELTTARVEPRYIASYVTTTEVDGHPLVSRETTVAVSLTDEPRTLEPMYDW